jgi:hypothetical protein
MTELAAVVLAHDDPVHLRRLIDALSDLPVFLHVDAKAATMTSRLGRLPAPVRLLPSRDAKLSSWSLVAAELSGLRAERASTRADHVAVLTGADYPLVSVDELLRALGPWRGDSYFYNRSLPFAAWSTRWHRDGGEWRARHRVLMRGDNLVTWRGRALHSPLKRRIPDGIELRAANQWKIYAREHVDLLLRVVDARPDLVRFWRSSFIPEETFVASVLGSRSLAGSAALRPSLANAWYYEFPTGGAHPRWLCSTDFERLAEARSAPAVGPRSAPADDGRRPPPQRKLFARKFSSRIDVAVLDRIDAELRR